MAIGSVDMEVDLLKCQRVGMEATQTQLKGRENLLPVPQRFQDIILKVNLMGMGMCVEEQIESTGNMKMYLIIWQRAGVEASLFFIKIISLFSFFYSNIFSFF